VLRSNPQPCKRPAQVHASTLFALTLAIVAGLILATLFKFVIWDRLHATQPVPPAPVFRLTVAAVNLVDKTVIQANQIKTVTVTQEQYEAAQRRARDLNTDLMTGTQPVGCVPKTTILAEEAIFRNQVILQEYPPKLGDLLQPGMRGAIVQVPASETMVQVGDYVDLFCTISNDNPTFGTGKTATAALVKGARVVARFNTTRIGALPPPGPMRSYPLEVTPYRYALIELAQKVGGTFTRSTISQPNGSQPPVTDYSKDPDTTVVTTADLARVFNITPPDRQIRWQVELWSGEQRKGVMSYPSYGTQMPAGVRPGAPSAPNPPQNLSSSLPGPTFTSTGSGGSPTALASAASGDANSGFRKPGPQGNCPT